MFWVAALIRTHTQIIKNTYVWNTVVPRTQFQDIRILRGLFRQCTFLDVDTYWRVVLRMRLRNRWLQSCLVWWLQEAFLCSS